MQNEFALKYIWYSYLRIQNRIQNSKTHNELQNMANIYNWITRFGKLLLSYVCLTNNALIKGSGIEGVYLSESENYS